MSNPSRYEMLRKKMATHHAFIDAHIFDARTCREVEESRDMENHKPRARRDKSGAVRCKDGAWRVA